MQAEIDRGEALSALFEKIWKMAESVAEQSSDPKKKRRSGKPKKPS